jgi:rfaE bifunctional protein nucleotidyltransferase chain/domain
MDHLSQIRNKIFYDAESFEPFLKIWKEEGKRIVFTNGCFDLLHRGHIEYLARAASKADKLVIGLNSDASVSRLKGEDRPVTDELSRALILASFGFVDAVFIFDEDTPLNLIIMVKPDFLIKGNDYSVKEIAGSEFVMSYGGRVETVDLVPGYSTSSLIGKIKRNDQD